MFPIHRPPLPLNQMGPVVDADHPSVAAGNVSAETAEGDVMPLTVAELWLEKGAELQLLWGALV